MVSRVCFVFLFFSRSPPPPPSLSLLPAPINVNIPASACCFPKRSWWTLPYSEPRPFFMGLGVGLFSFLLHFIQFSLLQKSCLRGPLARGWEAQDFGGLSIAFCPPCGPAPLLSFSFELHWSCPAPRRGLPRMHSWHFMGRCPLSLSHCRKGECLR